jgi:predicted 2-oxoglutarate/Fe(II)-dependent dioxygenase YbiX
MNDIKDYIVVVKDALSHELCQEIIKEYAFCGKWEDTVVAKGIDKDIRSAQTILMSQDAVLNQNYETRKKLDDGVYQGASYVMSKYRQQFPQVLIEQDSGYELLRYETGQFYVEHTDSFMRIPRTVSCSFSLNDDYEGGEFAFFGREISIRVPVGSAILFPSNFMYPHEILPVTNGTRYSIITWFI